MSEVRGIGEREALEWLNDIEQGRRTLEELCAEANAVRITNMGSFADSCSIMNARSGRCSEDCKWCSQSVHHRTAIDIYPLVDTGEALRHARDNHSKGIRRFSLVTSGRAMSDAEIDKVCVIYRSIAARMPELSLCASMGLLDEPKLKRLHEAGVTNYHCNIESAPSYFPMLCTTHSMQEKLNTFAAARAAGLQLCSGVIIGMGESAAQRVEMALLLQKTGVISIPINVLNPIAGTPLENQPPLSGQDILVTFALFRLINPGTFIRFAGGRTLLPAGLQQRLLRSGANAAIMGDMLTTLGQSVAEDQQMFLSEGFTFTTT